MNYANFILFPVYYAFYANYAFFGANKNRISGFSSTGNRMRVGSQGRKCIMLNYAHYAFGSP